ncbi:30S ribosomal protein S1 [Desulfuromonas versatilis]|uniref:30S ribosomal protein S1 n=1 Tax=Desulfuromonas versatilis TaxID=2802975 RepID=A0ABM9SDE4_9BACT|nr:30S ribosomal protein S1 [Desulfuromonas versatilis]BCR03299.1 30S ribosomal protein S1 [Desulfuromonas versatilis]
MVDDHDELDDSPESEDFAALLEQSLVKTSRLEPGQKIEARVLKISTDWVFLDVGQKGEGVLDKKELLDPEGNLGVAEGDTLAVYFLSRAGGELRFTTRIGGAGAGDARLEEAFRSGIPVDGSVVKEIKGGYEIRLSGGTRGFCPYSQMGLGRSQGPEEYLDKHLPFRITRYEERGRNIVVSHRAILEEERLRLREQLKGTLAEGALVQGRVTSLQKFGAFVDIGGIEGLVPISEIAWGRVEDIGEVLSVGQQVEVAVKSLDWENNRFSFSLKETLADPWSLVAQKYPEGSVHSGKVARLAPFGAFVTLEEGIDGLVHISKLGAGKRINHPREVVREGEDLEVRIEGVDPENRRISLALAGSAQAEQEAEPEEDFRRYVKQDAAAGMGTLGDLLRTKMQGGKKK